MFFSSSLRSIKYMEVYSSWFIRFISHIFRPFFYINHHQHHPYLYSSIQSFFIRKTKWSQRADKMKYECHLHIKLWCCEWQSKHISSVQFLVHKTLYVRFTRRCVARFGVSRNCINERGWMIGQRLRRQRNEHTVNLKLNLKHKHDRNIPVSLSFRFIRLFWFFVLTFCELQKWIDFPILFLYLFIHNYFAANKTLSFLPSELSLMI